MILISTHQVFRSRVSDQGSGIWRKQEKMCSFRDSATTVSPSHCQTFILSMVVQHSLKSASHQPYKHHLNTLWLSQIYSWASNLAKQRTWEQFALSHAGACSTVTNSVASSSPLNWNSKYFHLSLLFLSLLSLSGGFSTKAVIKCLH